MAFGFPAKYSTKIGPGIPRDAARDAAQYVFEMLGWTYFESPAGDCVVEKGISFNSWGERFLVSFSEPGSVLIESKCLIFQIFDWGKNTRNVVEFLTHFEGRLERNMLDPKPEPEHYDADGRTPVGRVFHESE